MPTELVTFVLHNVVNEPDKLAIEVVHNNRGVRFNVRCAEGDAGRIIGRGGRVINAIRTVARAASDGQQRIEVQLLDE